MADKTRKSAEKGDADRLISLAEAAEISGLSHSHLRLLVRQGKLQGRKIGHNWVTTEAAINQYLTTERRPGPKSEK